METTHRILRFDVLAITSIVLILIALLFHLALFIKQLGAGDLLHIFYVIDQALFDAGDLLFLFLLPLVTFFLTVAALFRQPSRRLPFILLAVVLGFYLTASVTSYAIIDAFYESHHLTLYGE